MPDRSQITPLCLGVLYPGDGTDTRILHLERWLPAHGIAGVAARVERPPSWGGHGREALLGLGGAENLRPSALKLAEAGVLNRKTGERAAGLTGAPAARRRRPPRTGCG